VDVRECSFLTEAKAAAGASMSRFVWEARLPVDEARALGETVSIGASHLAALYEEHVGRATALATLLTGDEHVAETSRTTPSFGRQGGSGISGNRKPSGRISDGPW
jgi:hypothetical protein